MNKEQWPMTWALIYSYENYNKLLIIINFLELYFSNANEY